MNKIVELLIDWDSNEYDDLGVDIMSLVSQPAIGYQWQAFSQEEEADHQDFAVELFNKCGETFGMDDIFIELKEFEFISISDIAKGITSLDILGKRNADEEGVTKYVYTGPISSNSRNFCKAMIRMNKLYSAEDLKEVGLAMKSQFPTLYPDSVRLVNGQLSGGVAQWLGGSNCNHYWNEVEVFSEGNGPKVVVSKGRANSNGVEGESMSSRFKSESVNQTWHFSDDEQMVITGPAMVPDMLIPRRDKDGNTFHVFFSSDTVKDIARKFLEESKHNNTDINHDDSVVQENVLLESWIVEDNKMDKSTVLGFDVPKGSWMVSYKINNEETWAKIKSGELTGFSVAGDFAEKLS
jgi:hypothetical protein